MTIVNGGNYKFIFYYYLCRRSIIIVVDAAVDPYPLLHIYIIYKFLRKIRYNRRRRQDGKKTVIKHEY